MATVFSPSLAPGEKSARSEKVLVLDFGSQYSQLIARRVRELNVYCELVPGDTPWPELEATAPSGLVLSGGPASVYEAGAPQVDPRALRSGLPVLGICYGMQLIAHNLGGEVAPGSHREYGPALISVAEPERLFAGLPEEQPVWMSHGDHVLQLPPGFKALASSANSPCAAFSDGERILGIQFHPEVAHTPHGKDILRNFLTRVCGCTGAWTAGSFIAESIDTIRATVGAGRVICALSGGVDSSVVAALVHRAIGDQLTCVFVDNGLLRKDEAQTVVHTFRDTFKINLVHVDASRRFLDVLRGVTDPELKRKRIGNEFIAVFEDEARKLGDIPWLAQGTLYPDVIESVSFKGPSATIKTHHNVGGLPTKIPFKLLEPLRELFKDEVRRVGELLGLPAEIVWRQPFPGPGLAIRVLGEVTPERLELLRDADAIVQAEGR